MSPPLSPDAAAELGAKVEVAAHEAGHVVVAAALCSGPVEAWIRLERTGGPFDERRWMGKTKFTPAGLSLLEIAAIGVSGMVAEELFRDETITADSIIERWGRGKISPSKSDSSGVPDLWEDRAPAVTTALDTIKRDLDLWHWAMGELIEKDAIALTSRSSGHTASRPQSERPPNSRLTKTTRNA